MSSIIVNDLVKIYETYNKQKGLSGTIHNLFKREKLQKVAVSNISFNIKEGETVGFVGMNGAGKTTTLKMLAGILKPTSGEININGFTPFEKKSEYLKQITMVMGNKSQLWWDIPAIDFFELNKSIYNVKDADYNIILDELVESLSVQNLLNVQVRKLSLGERMKMELIAALIHKPKVLFLDEPTIGIDIISQKSIYDFLKEYRKKHNTTIMLTSHNFDDISALCDRLILIDNGKKIYDDKYEKFMQQYNQYKIITIIFSEGHNHFKIKDIVDKYDVIYCDGNILKLSVAKNETMDLARVLSSEYADILKEFTIENMDIKEHIRKIYEKS